MSMTFKEKYTGEFGDEPMSHWQFNETKCDIIAPGDAVVEKIEEVDCPKCKGAIDRLRSRRELARISQ